MTQSETIDKRADKNRLQPDDVADIPAQFDQNWAEIEAEVSHRNFTDSPVSLRICSEDNDLLGRVSKNIALTLGNETCQESAVYVSADFSRLETLSKTNPLDSSSYSKDRLKLDEIHMFQEQLSLALRASDDEPTVLSIEHIGSVTPQVRSLILPVLDKRFCCVRHQGHRIKGNPSNLVVVSTESPKKNSLSQKMKRLLGGRWDFSLTSGESS
jgi:hypothetical protein